jgi:ABC-2 type transport system permease protein
MSQFIGLMRHEFKMAVKRPGMWIAYGVLYIFYIVTVFSPDNIGSQLPQTTRQMFQFAGLTMFYANMFMVILGGILAADRMQRDFGLGVRELQKSSPLKSSTYVFAKYTGVLAAVISPMLLFVVAYAIYFIAKGVPFVYLGISLLVFLAMGGSAFVFVVAFSLACPLFMPVRVYQVLFVGYWFWGNYLSPDVFPTISETLLVPSGKYPLYGFFGGFPDYFSNFAPTSISTVDAVLNLVILVSISVAVLWITVLFIQRQTSLA